MKPFDCQRTCKYCVAEGCEERIDPYYQTVATFSFPAYSPVKVYIAASPMRVSKVTINGRVVRQE